MTDDVPIQPGTKVMMQEALSEAKQLETWPEDTAAVRQGQRARRATQSPLINAVD